MVKYKIGDALKKGIALLNENSIETAGLDARILLCKALGCDSVYLTVHREDEMPQQANDEYFSYIDRRSKREPVGYIIGKKEFMSMDFVVTRDVLIPRPDTEILVERALDFLKDKRNPLIIDMCTGSGAIAVSLAKYSPGALVIGLDISEPALAVARQNARMNGVDITFDIHNVLVPYTSVIADCVVSNPPYIPTEVVEGLESDVVDYEPCLALDGGSDGLDFYKAIVSNISACLKKGGLLAFEVGMGQAEDVVSLMEPFFYNISVDKDLAGIERVVYGYLK